MTISLAGKVAVVRGAFSSFYTYMASDYDTFFTGTILMMDGGFTAQ